MDSLKTIKFKTAKHKLLISIVYIAWILAVPSIAIGEDAPSSSTYTNLDPPFVVNFGGKGRLHYLKADIALRVTSSASQDQVRHHMPHIRNNIILLLSQQTSESLMSSEGKEALRVDALKTIQDIIEQEDGHHGIEDLLFINFVVQR